MIKKIFLNLATCLPFVYFGTILFLENENRANMHICPLLCFGSCVKEQYSNVWSQTAESSIGSDYLPLWKLIKMPDIPVVWGVCPPAVLLVFLQSLAQRTISPVRWSMPLWPRDLELLKELYLTGGTCYGDASSASVHFSGSGQLWEKLRTASPTSSSSHTNLPGHPHIRLVPTLPPAPQFSCKLSLATVSCTGCRWKAQLPCRRTS